MRWTILKLCLAPASQAKPSIAELADGRHSLGTVPGCSTWIPVQQSKCQTERSLSRAVKVLCYPCQQGSCQTSIQLGKEFYPRSEKSCIVAEDTIFGIQAKFPQIPLHACWCLEDLAPESSSLPPGYPTPGTLTRQVINLAAESRFPVWHSLHTSKFAVQG